MYLKITEQGIQWPYYFNNLQQDYPNVSFCINPTTEDLSPFGVFKVQESPRPTLDERLQKVEEAQPHQVDDQWFQSWTIRDATEEEIAFYDAQQRPPADWSTFKTTLLEDEEVNLLLSESMTIAPLAVLALPASLISVSNGMGTGDFFSIWTILRQKQIVLPALIQRVVNLAEFCTLPEAFISSLQETL